MLGISRTLRAGSKPFFHEDDFATISMDPRFLILRIVNVHLRCLVIVAHAPHLGHTDTEIEQWWESLSAAIPQRYLDWGIILLSDANAHVGKEPCEHIGPHQAEPMDSKSEHFVHFIQRHNLWIPSTFSDCQSGEGKTWRHSTGHCNMEAQ